MTPRAQHTSNINVRLRPEEVEYLNEQADRLEVSLSESVRLAIARSYLVDREAGVTSVDSWIHPEDDTLLDVEPDAEASSSANADEGT